MGRIGKLLLTGLFTWGLFACGNDDDDYVYPSVVTTFAEVHTNTAGVTDRLTTDEGKAWAIPENRSLNGLTPDSIYRMVAKYEPQDTEVTLYVIQRAIAPQPKLQDEFKEMHTDPVELTSIWRGGNYLNIVVKAQVKDQTHAYHFIDQGVSTDENDGHRCLHLKLYHDRNNDAEAFSRTVYLSVPLLGYADTLRQGDSIRFSLATYTDSLIQRTFAW